MAKPARRFRDPRSTTYDFLDSVMVRCPACEKAARVVPAPREPGPQVLSLFRPRRLVCLNCGLSRTWSGRCVALARGTSGPATDPYFGLPLWLQTETRHGWLWAYDLEHLDLIRRFAEATLRERAPWYDHGRKMTLVARLPVWVKRAGNRDEIVRAVDRIRASLVTA
ncbi:hypothetical protein [Streptomyces sp. NPDC052225]|uniref:hypothetical protein n=1 Tax=Streptomyces sp. NPDC052225 TaxID=3154949 RepID=UPI003425917C